MYPRTTRLNRLMSYYQISKLGHGAKEDKLGDVFEDYCVEIFSDNYLLDKAKAKKFDSSNTDEIIFNSVFANRIMPYIDEINKICATKDIEHRFTGGSPKTDVIIDLETVNGYMQIPVSVKQTTAPKVAMAEFDVDTIVREIGIQDDILIKYLEKHQRDASAKYFTAEEKADLTNRLKPYVRKFVRWVVTGTPHPTDDLDRKSVV